jgi:hypothetical protein
MFTAGVVEVLACGEYLNALRSAACGSLQQSGMKPLIQE